MLCFSNPRVAAPTTNARRNEFPRRPYCRQLGFREYLMVETKCTGIPYTGSPVSGKAQNRQLSLRESHTPEAEFPGIHLLKLSEKPRYTPNCNLKSRRNGSQKPYFAAGDQQNRGSGRRSSPFSDSFSETVRKVPTGSELKPQKSTKRSKKPYFAAVGSQNGGSSGYSKPFSDSLSRQLGE